MKIFIGQVYIKVGVTFPFSLRFQKWFGDALSGRVDDSQLFAYQFGNDFGLGFRISAKDNISQPEILGPTVFKRDKNVEYTIFLPHEKRNYYLLQVAADVFNQLLESVVLVLTRNGFSTKKIVNDMQQLLIEFQNTPGLLKKQ
jgi:hypothetical protein